MTLTAERAQLIHDTFVTAMEDGVQYWAAVEDYHWSDGQGNNDLTGFGATLVDHEDEDEPSYVVNAGVVLRGLTRMAANDCEVPPGHPEHFRGYVARAAGWLADPENADLDAGDADVVIQAGLFGKIIYG